MALAEPHVARRVGVVVIGAAATIGTYEWLLFHSGPDRRPVSGASSYLRGPYVSWHVALVIVILGLGAIWSGWLGFPLLGALVETAALVSCWSITAATDPTSNTAWPIGAVLIGWVCLGGSLLAGSVVAQVRVTLTERAARLRHELAVARAREAAELAARLAAEEAAKLAAQHAARDAAMARAAEATRLLEAERAARAAEKAKRVKVAKVLASSGKTAVASARGRVFRKVS